MGWECIAAVVLADQELITLRDDLFSVIQQGRPWWLHDLILNVLKNVRTVETALESSYTSHPLWHQGTACEEEIANDIWSFRTFQTVFKSVCSSRGLKAGETLLTGS